MRIAVVILNWNGEQMLRRFLPSVVRWSAEKARIIVADNGSTDGSMELLASDFPSVERLPLGRNYGFAEGYQQALHKIESEFYVLLNSDVEVTEGWLDAMLAYMDAHPEVAACQPKLRATHTPTHFEYAGAAGGFIDAYGYPFCRGRLFACVEADEGQYDDVCDIFWATGAAMFIRSSAYWAVGGLDGRFFAHQEEIDLCWRLRARGWRLVCVPQSVVYHVGGGTLPKENPRKTFLNFRNNLLLLYKNLPEARLKRVMRWRFVLDALASAVFLLKGEWGSCKAVWQGRREFCRMQKDFEQDRAANLAATTVEPIKEIYPKILLWAFYVRRVRSFARLMR